MARYVALPVGIPDPPHFEPRETYIERCAAWTDTIKGALRRVYPGELVGEVLRWPRADGYAQYIVVSERPLQVAHLSIMDAWTVEEALIRGLRLADVRQMVERSRKLAALFSKEA